MIRFDPEWDHLFQSDQILVQTAVRGTFHTCYYDSEQTEKVQRSGQN